MSDASKIGVLYLNYELRELAFYPNAGKNFEFEVTAAIKEKFPNAEVTCRETSCLVVEKIWVNNSSRHKEIPGLRKIVNEVRLNGDWILGFVPIVEGNR